MEPGLPSVWMTGIEDIVNGIRRDEARRDYAKKRAHFLDTVR